MTTDSHAREKQALQEESAAKQARIAAEERAQADRIPAALERIAEAVEIERWRDIEDYPEQPMPVLFYGSLMEWRNHLTGEIVEIPPIQPVRYGLGYWDGKAWREQYTNHEVFEFDARPGDAHKPTHWAPLLAPPALAARRARKNGGGDG